MSRIIIGQQCLSVQSMEDYVHEQFHSKIMTMLSTQTNYYNRIIFEALVAIDIITRNSRCDQK